MKKPRIVIVGAGFGGIKTALELAEDTRFHVTLISDHINFRYYPTLYRTATGGRKILSSIPLSEIFSGKNVHIIIDRVVSLDRVSRTVKTKIGHVIGFESLVLAMGVYTNYFGIKGLKELSYGIKTNKDAQELKAHLHNQLIINNEPDLNYVVVGGGPSGIELAGVLPAYLNQISRQHRLKKRKIHVDLVEAAPRLVPRMPKDVSRRITYQLRRLGVKIYLNTAVSAQTADTLVINNKSIRSHTVIWTAGVSNNTFFTNNEFQVAKNGKVRVDQFLQTEMGIYVIGDNADTPYSGMAQTALHDGKFVAANLKRIADKHEPVPYTAKKPVFVFPAGHRWAAVLWGKVRLYGKKGWLLRSLADLVAYHDYEPWQIATRRWAAENDNEEVCTFCTDKLH